MYTYMCVYIYIHIHTYTYISLYIYIYITICQSGLTKLGTTESANCLPDRSALSAQRKKRRNIILLSLPFSLRGWPIHALKDAIHMYIDQARVSGANEEDLPTPHDVIKAGTALVYGPGGAIERKESKGDFVVVLSPEFSNRPGSDQFRS